MCLETGDKRNLHQGLCCELATQIYTGRLRHFRSSCTRSSQLKAHVLGAVRNGCTVDEIQEALLQSAVYCGVPSGIEAFRAAKEVIENWES